MLDDAAKIIVSSKDGDYPVYIGAGLFGGIPGLLKDGYDKVLIITDQNIFKFHDKKITALTKIHNTALIVLPSGENTKSMNNVNKIISFLIEEKYTRQSLIVAIGGGVIGDLSGLSASIYMRGIKIIHVPTTLIASVDSSVGGKTAVNYKGLKNVVGTFHNPKMVIVDPSFLKTLPEDEFKSGMGEVIKYAFLEGGQLYKKAAALKDIKKTDAQELIKIIYSCLVIKSSITSLDEKDKGLRQLLNFGHTFAHAYESASRFKLKHGYAVTLGIISSLYLSHELNIFEREELKKYLRILEPFISPEKYRFKENVIYSYMQMDKKKVKEDLNFVLLRRPGEMLLNVKTNENNIISSIHKSLI